MIKLFVVGYPLDIEEVEFIELFSIHGMVDSVHLLTDKITRQPKGFGFVEMIDQPGADRAIATLNGIVLKGRKITVKLADEDRERKPRSFKGNRFSVPTDLTGDSRIGENKGKKPRKLMSNTFRVKNS
ncbi:RNA recognition motif domain-containing protein [Pedobacter polysacchareus]|uniref:RNA recognition motif domain-containing protein n=1 Tax=Pedobacter polysacchareus TaxID=2861973 RepID=UPI001C9A1E66|nr:RNA-binding protein [Pedobacter polysacchareus]